MLTYALIGYGQRGSFYVDCLYNNHPNTKFVACCDSRTDKLELVHNRYGLTESQCFVSDKEFFAQGKIADFLIIASMDQAHYAQAVTALKLGYDLVLEKPIASTQEQCEEIAKLAMELGRQVYVCHVLRYAPIYAKIKEIIASGEVGEVRSISQTEHVGWWHQAHSFVRGNWRKAEDTNPMIVAKCCHDLDLFVWLTGKDCKKITSFGSLSYFKKENAPEGSADYCFECPLKDECCYNSMKFYKKYPSFAFASGQYLGDGEDKDAIEKTFSTRENPYARCVFKCDNDVVDNQIVNMEFEDGVTAQLTMTAFCEGGIRTIRVFCTKGYIEASMLDNVIKYDIFGKDKIFDGETIKIKVEVGESFGGHGGGDERMVADIVQALSGNADSLGLTSVDKSVMSHMMGFSAEKSRLNGGQVVEIQSLK